MRRKQDMIYSYNSYLLMLDSLKRKGGLFSEFYNKNRTNLDLLNAERKLRKLHLKGNKKQ